MTTFSKTARVPLFVPNGPAPTGEQLAIQLANERVCLVQANAGAGKTSVLVSRIGEAIARGVSPSRVLALTFTDTAAAVLRRRLAHAGVHTRSAEQVSVFTFDKFSRHVLAKLPGDGSRATQIHLDRDLSPWVEQAMNAVAEDVAESYPAEAFDANHINIAETIGAMRRLKGAGVLFDDVYDEVQEEMLDHLGVTRAQLIITVEYERLRRGRSDEPQFRDPYDATYDLAVQLGIGAIGDTFLGPYNLVVCDEQHDFNEAAYRVLYHVLQANGCRFLGVGDKDQVIHAMLGASDVYMGQRFEGDFSPMAIYPLTRTFRHGPHIAYPIAAFKQKRIDSYVREHTPIKTIVGESTDYGVANAVVADVSEWLVHGHEKETCAILLRDWHQAALIEEQLWRGAIRYQAPDGLNFQQREEIRFVRGVFAYAVDGIKRLEPHDRVSIVATLALFGNVQFDGNRLREIQAILAKTPELFEDFLNSWLLGEASGAPPTAVGRLVIELRENAATLTAKDAFALIRRRIDFQSIARRLYASPYDVNLVLRSLNALESVMSSKPKKVEDFFDSWIQSIAFATSGRRVSRLLIDTVSNVKGREFDRVILPYMDYEEFPDINAASEHEENLFYVAATRARKKLVLITSSPQLRHPSPFLKRLDLARAELRADNALDRNQNDLQQGASIRIYLKHYNPEDRDEIESLGACRDRARRQWYITSDMDVEPFLPWL
ncbi:UvrD-helicase domain-containing protein [Pandoraea communis]|nr:UvrD-helicase domain-containing protein [Pandoraea communis]